MELRDIEIFLTLAEELHFGRTAERLHLTQARVSQSIKKQERQIGAALFERTSRKVTLTPLGRQLVEDLRPVHQTLHQSVERAKLAARGKADVLRIGMTSSNVQDLQPYLKAFIGVHPECETQFRDIGFGDPFGGLRAGEIDIAILWLPVREPDLTVGPVAWTEAVILAMSVTHRLAQGESVSYEDLGDEVVMGGAQPDYWRDALVPRRTPSGRAITIGPYVTNTGEMLPILAAGEAVSPGFAHAQRYYPRSDIAYVPISDAPPARWAVVWRTVTETALTRDFAKIVEQNGPLTL